MLVLFPLIWLGRHSPCFVKRRSFATRRTRQGRILPRCQGKRWELLWNIFAGLKRRVWNWDFMGVFSGGKKSKEKCVLAGVKSKRVKCCVQAQKGPRIVRNSSEAGGSRSSIPRHPIPGRKPARREERGRWPCRWRRGGQRRR